MASCQRQEALYKTTMQIKLSPAQHRRRNEETNVPSDKHNKSHPVQERGCAFVVCAGLCLCHQSLVARLDLWDLHRLLQPR